MGMGMGRDAVDMCDSCPGRHHRVVHTGGHREGDICGLTPEMDEIRGSGRHRVDDPFKAVRSNRGGCTSIAKCAIFAV